MDDKNCTDYKTLLDLFLYLFILAYECSKSFVQRVVEQVSVYTAELSALCVVAATGHAIHQSRAGRQAPTPCSVSRWHTAALPPRHTNTLARDTLCCSIFSVKFCCIRENVILSTACSRLIAYLFLITLCICRLQMFYFLSRDATICIARCVPSTLFVCPLCSYNVSNGSTQ